MASEANRAEARRNKAVGADGGRKPPLSKAMLASVAVGVAGSLVVVPLTYLQMVATLGHAFAVAATLGLWVVPCLLPQAMVRRPGASLVACGAIGAISAVTTPYGISAIPALLFEGFVVELPFMVTLYRRWSKLQCFAGGVLLGGFMGYLVPAALGIAGADPGLSLGCMSIAAASSLVGSWVALSLGEKVRRTGVLGE